MIRRKEELKTVVQNGVKGGVGEMLKEDLVFPEELDGAGRLFAKIILPPGSSCGKHPHAGDFEIYHILRGVATVDDDGTVCELRPGDTHLCRNGGSHGIVNNGTEDLEYIAAILFSK